METYLRICPCVLLSELNDRGIVASCEIDMCSAISMRAMSLASEGPAAVLDWNNNYGDDEDKIILFHCGPVAQSLMAGKGTVTEHKMFAKNDPGSGWGCNEGRIKPMPITISNCQTKDGKIVIYAPRPSSPTIPIEDGYFGCGGVAEIPHLQDKCITLAKAASSTTPPSARAITRTSSRKRSQPISAMSGSILTANKNAGRSQQAPPFFKTPGLNGSERPLLVQRALCHVYFHPKVTIP